MPHLLDTRSSRRSFLVHAAGTVAGALTLRTGIRADEPVTPQAGTASVRQPDGSLRLALLADTHVPADATDTFRGFRPVDNLRLVAAQVAQADVDLALVAGDLARLVGTPGDYAALRTLLEPMSDRRPVGLVLGNHDDRTHFRAAFPSGAGESPAVPNKHVLVIEQGGLRFVLLDSLLAPNVTPGQLGNAQRAWLRGLLEASAPLPTIVVVHHTLDGNDGSLVDSERLFEVLRPFPQVKAIVYGHSHRYDVEPRDGVQLINLPAVGYNFADNQPVGWIESAWRGDGVALTLRAIGGHRAEDGRTREVGWLR